MTTWSEAAQAHVEKYFGRLKPDLVEGGADPEEVISDLRQTLEREARAEGLTVVTEADVRRLLGRIGAPEPKPTAPPPVDPSAAGQAAPSNAGESPQRQPPGIWTLLFGVVLPAAAFMLEWATGMCAAAFFDPMPTVGHQLLVASVPLINLWTWMVLRRAQPRVGTWLVWANGLAIGVAIFCSVRFLPLLLPGLLAVWFFGWGLLPWAPLLSLVVSTVLRRRLRLAPKPVETSPWARTWPAVLAVLLVLGALEISTWATLVGLGRAASTEPTEHLGGVHMLRRLGHHETLLRACYGRTERSSDMDLLGLLFAGRTRVAPMKAREIYYEVYGRPFNLVPAPELRSARGSRLGVGDWTWDEDQGGEQVGGRLVGLHLQGSRLDATVEADAAIVYCEWVLEFRNEANQPQEARAQVQLPPGGAVSRLTLWINGEEREAAFAGRSRVKQAYQSVAIRQRRDPVLVTTAGPDRVLVQCFPVPAQGTMKIRLGISAPLHLRGPVEGLFRWPQIVERNFSLPASLRHSAWLDSRDAQSLACGRLGDATPDRAGRVNLHGELAEADFAGGSCLVRVRRADRLEPTWAVDPRGEVDSVVRQVWARETARPATNLLVVLDGSVAMRPAARAVADALEALPATVNVRVWVAQDDPEAPLELPGPGDRAALGQHGLAARIRALSFAGGRDNVGALLRAWDAAAASPGSLVLWIHGPQPVELGSADALRQRTERAPGGPRILSLQVSPGPHRLLEKLDRLPRFESAPRFGALGEDLAACLNAHCSGEPRLRTLRTVEAGNAGPGAGERRAHREASFHLVRLWALDQIRSGRLGDAQAMNLAAVYQLVVPVSGAVVLETEEQYRMFGLQASAKDSVPQVAKPGLAVEAGEPLNDIKVVPEPSTVGLLSLGLAALAAAIRGRRRH